MHRPTILEKIVNGVIKLVLRILCRVDVSEVDKLPLKGPYLLVVNHINFLDIPVLYLYLLPRRVTALVKKETWDKPLHGFLGNLWRAIPVRRGIVDTKSMQLCLEYLSEGGILFVAPEGTRSSDGRLRKGKGGIVPLAIRAGVPVYPVTHYGGENFWNNIKHWRRTDITIQVGQPFYIKTGNLSVTSRIRKEITEQVMLKIAELLPEEYRGVYKDTSRRKESPYIKAIADESRGII